MITFAMRTIRICDGDQITAYVAAQTYRTNSWVAEIQTSKKASVSNVCGRIRQTERRPLPAASGRTARHQSAECRPPLETPVSTPPHLAFRTALSQPHQGLYCLPPPTEFDPTARISQWKTSIFHVFPPTGVTG